MALDLPPKLFVPATPAIIRPADARLLSPGFLPASRQERRAALAELLRTGKLTKKDAANALVVRWPYAPAMLVGMCIGSVPKPAFISIAFNTSAASASDLTTYTFSSVIATATRPRKCVAVFTARSATATISLSSCTLAGVAATCTTLSGSNNSLVAIAVVDVPAGSSGDAVPTFNTGMARAAVATYDMFDASSNTPTATGADVADPYTYSLTCTAGSVVFAGGTDAESSVSWSWTNLTENADGAYGADAQSYSMASAAFAAAQSGLTLTGDISATLSGCGGFAVFSQ